MHCQDLRIIGNLVFQIPSILSCLNVANIALCGLPFLSGFYSKDLIMEVLIYNSYSFFLVLGFIVGVLFTTIYSFRVYLRDQSMNMFKCCRNFTYSWVFCIIVIYWFPKRKLVKK